MKRIALVSVLCAFSWMIPMGVANCASKTLEIGALYPLTDSLALLGEESFRGAELARIQRNKAGGVAGAEIVYVQGDASTVSAARSEAERLLEQKKVPLIIGTFASSRCMAASEVASRKGVPYFEFGAIANEITARGYKTMWRTNATASDFAKAQIEFIVGWLAPHLKKKPSEVKVSIAHEDSDYGTSVATSFSKVAKDAGVQVVSVEPYAANSSDLSPVILRLRQADPDIVVAVSYAQDAILLSRQAHELKLKAPFLGTGGGHTLQSFADAVGPIADVVFNVDFPQYEVNPEFCPGLKEFVAAYKEKYGALPRSGHSLANYVGALILFDILEKTGGNTDPDAIRKAAMSLDIPMGKTANGWGLKFGDNGQNVRAPAFVSQWQGGKLVTVWPKSAAVAEPKMPKTE
ncbi:MAG: ABC transporter substrate-binding protein [Syntrophobacteraceae bacterium]